ncbi:MAG: anaerobic ribonucleoside-triphosphate reductase activating protein [Parcubacteria group bacterium]|nr:anaerobic ribonucleoside-triphosphate reductase activating protein [Parcubacteria group bacterium]
MIFGGLQKTTLVDYPGKVAATVFTVGCNFYCPYCHNPELVLPELIQKHPQISEEEVINFLTKRKGLLEGLCITGGEPTLHSDLISFLEKVKSLDYFIKLDSNGSQPKVLKEIIEKKLVDYLAMDIKTSLEKYHLVTLNQVPKENIQESISLIKNSGFDYEFRTTVAPEIVTEEDIWSIVDLIKPARAYFLQTFKGIKTLDPRFATLSGLPEEKLKQIITQIKPFFKECGLR